MPYIKKDMIHYKANDYINEGSRLKYKGRSRCWDLHWTLQEIQDELSGNDKRENAGWLSNDNESRSIQAVRIMKVEILVTEPLFTDLVIVM